MESPEIEAVIRKVLADVIEPKRLAFTEPEAAALLGVQSHVLRDARLRGEITPTKLGSRIGYSRRELDAYLLRGQSLN